MICKIKNYEYIIYKKIWQSFYWCMRNSIILILKNEYKLLEILQMILLYSEKDIKEIY